MKKIIVMICLGALALTILLAQASRGGTMFVAAKTVDLKSSTGFFAAVTDSLEYGDQVSVLQVKGSWAEVSPASDSSVSGWTSTAGLSAKRIVASGATGTAISEVALAGKGFNEEVENGYRSEASMIYAEVDKMESLEINNRELYDFLVEGHLSLGE